MATEKLPPVKDPKIIEKRERAHGEMQDATHALIRATEAAHKFETYLEFDSSLCNGASEMEIRSLANQLDLAQQHFKLAKSFYGQANSRLKLLDRRARARHKQK